MKNAIYTGLFAGLFCCVVNANSACQYSGLSVAVSNLSKNDLTLASISGGVNIDSNNTQEVKIPAGASYTYTSCGDAKSHQNFKTGVTIGSYSIYLDHGPASPDYRNLSAPRALPTVKLNNGAQSYWLMLYGPVNSKITYTQEPSLNCKGKNCTVQAEIQIQ